MKDITERADYYARETILRITSYGSNANLYVEQILPEELDSPLGTGNVLSLSDLPKLGYYEAYIDTETFPDALRMIVETGSGVPTGTSLDEGGRYPLLRFSPEKLKEMDEIGEKSYVYYGGITRPAREQAKKAFKTTVKQVLSSKQSIESLLNRGIHFPTTKPSKQTERE